MLAGLYKQSLHKYYKVCKNDIEIKTQSKYEERKQKEEKTSFPEE